MEYILCAAICNPDEKDLAGDPLIYCGHRHHTILRQGSHVSQKLQHQGFLTSTGRFVNRREAFSVAAEAGQLKKIARNPIIGLFSEDLY
jgi:hypothetical protein